MIHDGEVGFSRSGPPFVSSVVAERVPTSQHAIMSSAMLGAKRARMKVEADRQVLANRIARLQAEEMKAVKRIEETHRRTQEILSVKNRQQRSELEYGFSIDTLNVVCRFDGGVATVTHVQHVDACDRSHVPEPPAAGPVE